MDGRSLPGCAEGVELNSVHGEYLRFLTEFLGPDQSVTERVKGVDPRLSPLENAPASHASLRTHLDCTNLDETCVRERFKDIPVEHLAREK